MPQESAQEVADQVVKLVSSLSFEDLALLVKVVENPIYKTKALAELRKHMG
ncbi:MAG: hypothetical protein MRZ79_04730 [Bacteroidia bacterium]|nr:hypothetical protein [Bacteroidia bacterium]